jgi:hypothetical protein
MFLNDEAKRNRGQPPPIMHFTTYCNQRRWESLLEKYPEAKYAE